MNSKVSSNSEFCDEYKYLLVQQMLRQHPYSEAGLTVGRIHPRNVDSRQLRIAKLIKTIFPGIHLPLFKKQ